MDDIKIRGRFFDPFLINKIKIRGRFFDPFLIKGLKYPVRNKSH